MGKERIIKKIFALALAALFYIPILPPPVGAVNRTFTDNMTVQGARGITTPDLITRGPNLDVQTNNVLPSASAVTNTAGIQAAIDNAYAYGGADVHIFAPGTYLLARQGADPNWAGKYSALNMKSKVRLFIHPGVILKLDDGQNTDSFPTHIISIGTGTDMYIGGGGRITGNTAGQTGWTGGYGQSCDPAPCIISGRQGAGSGNIIIEDLWLEDYFSNPINLGSTGGAYTDNILMRNIHSKDIGEGPQVMAATNVVWENIYVSVENGLQMPGDGSELSGVNGFKVDGLFLKGTPGARYGASAIDVFGSSNGTINNVITQYWQEGVAIQPFYSGPGAFDAPVNITVSNVIIRDAQTSGLYVSGSLTRNITISNYIADNCGNHGAYIDGSNGPIPGPISISNSQFDNNVGAGILLGNVGNTFLSNVSTNGNSSDGVGFIIYDRALPTDNNQLMGNRVQGLVSRGNGGFGLHINDLGLGFAHTVSVNGLTADNNVSGRIFVGAGSLDKTIVTNVPPNEISGTNPSDGANGVSISSPITVTFIEAMDAASISTAVFILTGGVGNVTLIVKYSGTQVTLTPTSTLAYNTTYTATVTTLVKDVSGNQIASNYQWTFTTQQVSAEGGGGGGGGCSLLPTGKSDEKSPKGFILALLSPVFVLIMRKTICRSWARTKSKSNMSGKRCLSAHRNWM